MMTTPQNPAPMKEPLSLKIYRTASRFAEPVARIALQRRLKAGKEDAARIGERRGLAGRPRPEGALTWVHGASVGESLSVIPLLKRLHELQPDQTFLVTTGTTTSARLLAERLPENCFHQYIPLDHPDFVRAFLDHWRPQAALFVESELWPNLILATRETTPFMALVNGRMSPRSFEEWKRQPNFIKYILSSFDLILAQDSQNTERLEDLSGRDVLNFGNLKYAAPALDADMSEIAQLRETIGERPKWLAASTHQGEEKTTLAGHQILAPDYPGLLTIIAPRHPERADEVAALCAEQGLKVARRSKSEAILPDTDIYLADTLGELGLFYRLCDISFVGGSLTEKGGHNPLEPARLGAAILHGAHVFNFAETYAQMRRAGGAALIRNERELSGAVSRLLADEKTRTAMAKAAQDTSAKRAEEVLTRICDALLTQMPHTARA